MSVNTNWDIDKYRGKNEYEDHWQCRRQFMERWKSQYPEEKLVTFAEVHTNMQFMGRNYCPAPSEEAARMVKPGRSKDYRDVKNTKLQHTFVSANKAAEDSARGKKREGGAFVNETPKKLNKTAFVNSGVGPSQDDKEDINDIVTEPEKTDYMEELSHVRCIAATNIAEYMFNTKYGRLVLLVRSWETKLCNIQTSCLYCDLKYEFHHDEMTNFCSLKIEGKIVAQACGATKKISKKAVENLAWKNLANEAITILVKEQFISKDDSRIRFSGVPGGHQPGPREEEFGAPVEASVAARMMKMMAWQGGGLGADAQGMAEPVKPHMQIITRADLGSVHATIRQIRNAADSLMIRFLASDCLDLDLIFSSDFTKAERGAVHQAAAKARLQSRSHGQGSERFLVVKKKIDVFHLAQTIVKKGGSTPKYEIFIPAKVASFYRERE